MKRIAISSLGLVLSIGVGLAFSASPAGARTTSPPQIIATPDNVMVNTQITLTGSGFPAHMQLRILECSSTAWVVLARKPCDTANRIWVHTHAHGRFSSPFTAALCPRTPTPVPITQETCYVGVPEPSGVDTISLVGAAQVIVTYP